MVGIPFVHFGNRSAMLLLLVFDGWIMVIRISGTHFETGLGNVTLEFVGTPELFILTVKDQFYFGRF